MYTGVADTLGRRNSIFLIGMPFWTGRVSTGEQLRAWWRGDDVTFATELQVATKLPGYRHGCEIRPARLEDCAGIAYLLNEWFERRGSRTVTAVDGAWVRKTFLDRHALWIIALDKGNTVRGCVASFFTKAPYPNALSGCGFPRAWGVVDWYCVHPLWRDHGVGSGLLEALDVFTYAVGRKAHVFLKEGVPLPLPHIPIYGTMWWVRRAGNPALKEMKRDSGLSVWPFQAKDKETKLPLIRVEGIRDPKVPVSQIQEWEAALDEELPPSWVFVTSVDRRDDKRGWSWDSPVWLYAFRWKPGKWLGDAPSPEVL